MKIAFLSFKSILDINSGAALEIKSVLEHMARQGMKCASISMNCYDTGDNYIYDEKIDTRLNSKTSRGRFFHYDENLVRHYLYIGKSKDTMKIDHQDASGFFKVAADFFNIFSPDIVIFFGSSELLPLLNFSKNNGAKLILYAGTASYDHERRDLFDAADSVVVPTSFIKKIYESRFGQECLVIPTTLPFDIRTPSKARASARRLIGDLTLINPTPDKGGHFFFHVAGSDHLQHRKFLCVESRGTRCTWKNYNIDVDEIHNVYWAPWQPDIRRVLDSTAVLLIPSLVDEAAGKVISEAMAMGVPCVGFDIGGISEQIGGGGIVLPFDSRLAADPKTMQYNPYVPDDVVLPWVNILDTLLSKQSYYEQLVQCAVSEAERFLPERTIAHWKKNLTSLVRCP